MARSQLQPPPGAGTTRTSSCRLLRRARTPKLADLCPCHRGGGRVFVPVSPPKIKHAPGFGGLLSGAGGGGETSQRREEKMTRDCESSATILPRRPTAAGPGPVAETRRGSYAPLDLLPLPRSHFLLRCVSADGAGVDSCRSLPCRMSGSSPQARVGPCCVALDLFRVWPERGRLEKKRKKTKHAARGRCKRICSGGGCCSAKYMRRDYKLSAVWEVAAEQESVVRLAWAGTGARSSSTRARSACRRAVGVSQKSETGLQQSVGTRGCCRGEGRSCLASPTLDRSPGASPIAGAKKGRRSS